MEVLMEILAGPIGLLAGILALIPLFIATYLNRTMQKGIEAAETDERRTHLIAGREQMLAIGWKFLLVALVAAVIAIVLYLF